MHVFKHTLGSAQICTPDGDTLIFIGGTLTTENEDPATWIDEQIKKGNQYLSRGTAEEVKIAKSGDPLAVLKERMRAQVLAEIEAQRQEVANGAADMGTSEQKGLGQVATSVTLKGITK